MRVRLAPPSLERQGNRICVASISAVIPGAAQHPRALLLDGIDPIEACNEKRTDARLKAAKSANFRTCAERLIASHEGGWKSEKHKRQWRTTLETYAYPILGDLPVAAIETDLVMQVLTPI